MNWRTISRNVGYALLVSALFMLLSILVSVLNGNDSALSALIISFTITFIVGFFPFIFVRNTSPISLKEGYVIITLSWLLSFIFGMLPYMLWGGPFTIANAWFETVSGFTTTGSTILEDVEALPDSLLFWRSSTHFIGGLGVVVFLLLILPDTSPIRMRLTNMELSTLSKSGYSARTNKTVYIFAYVYLALGVLAFVSYLLAGMRPLDAICHAMSVSATGGFSTKNLSIAAFHSPAIEVITFVFMLLGSVHFGLLFMSVVHRSVKPLNNPVLKFYLLTLLVCGVLCGVTLKISGAESNLGLALWHGAFQTVSVASTTGLAVVDNANWPWIACVLLLTIGIMCGCAGSTSGGVKADRILVLLKSIGHQLKSILHPSSINEIKLGKRVIRSEQITPHLLYIALYFVLLAVSVILTLLGGSNMDGAIAGSLSSLSNVGPSIQEMGFMGNYSQVPNFSKLIFTLDMFLGRVEIYPILAVVAMIFDGRRK